MPGMCSHPWVTSPALALATPMGGFFAKWDAKSGGAQIVAATSLWACFYSLAGQWQRMVPGPHSSHKTGPTAQNVEHMSAWPLLLLLLHLTLCTNFIFQYMNSVFQCKNPLFEGFTNPIPSVHESLCFVPLGDLMLLLCQDPAQSFSLTQLCLLSSSRQLHLRTPEVLCHCCCCHPRVRPSDPNQPWKLLNAAGHGCDAHFPVSAAPSFPQLLTPEGVMNLGRDQCSALSQALF